MKRSQLAIDMERAYYTRDSMLLREVMDRIDQMTEQLRAIQPKQPQAKHGGPRIMFLRKTVDSIAAQFHKMVADLEDVIDHAQVQAEHHEEIINESMRQRLAHMEESARASKLASKIKELLS